jgi:hypothetical protein
MSLPSGKRAHREEDGQTIGLSRTGRVYSKQ